MSMDLGARFFLVYHSSVTHLLHTGKDTKDVSAAREKNTKIVSPYWLIKVKYK